VLEVEGPPHDRRFKCAATIDGDQVGTGSGDSKKAAEQEAAKEALKALGVKPLSEVSLDAGAPGLRESAVERAE
jgi:ribonuclease-3